MTAQLITGSRRMSKFQWICILGVMILWAGCGGNAANHRMPGFTLEKTGLSKGIQPWGETRKPIGLGSLFSDADDQAVAFIEYENLTGSHRFSWQWVAPDGSVYLNSESLAVSTDEDAYIEKGIAWHALAIRNENASAKPGKWRVHIFMDGRKLSTRAFEIRSQRNPLEEPETVAMPPMLSIQSLSFGRQYLEGGESGELKVVLKNTGDGEARDVYLQLSCDNPEIKVAEVKRLPLIPAETGTVTATIPVTASMRVKEGTASLSLQVVEPNFRVKITGKRVMIPTKPFRHPQLRMVQFAALESRSSQQNNRIDLNEIIDVKIAVQNVGQREATGIRIRMQNDQKGVMFLGQGEGQHLKKQEICSIPEIKAGKYEIINYRYFVNSEFEGSSLAFSISGTESLGDYGFTGSHTVPINTELKPEGRIERVQLSDYSDTKGVVIEDIPDFIVDVDADIPETHMKRPDDIAVVIGNSRYLHKDVPDVTYALRDARMVKAYLMKTMGFAEGNIIYRENIGKAGFEEIFGIKGNAGGRLNDYIKPGKSNVFVYLSGHGAPDGNDKQAYFLPVDCNPVKTALTGYSLELFYDNLAALKAKSVTVVLETCFSGGTSPGQSLVPESSPIVLVRVNQPDQISVLSSSKLKQVSSWYAEKQHGLFTYFFLKALRGDGDLNHDGQLALSEIHQFVSSRTEGVPYWARRLHGRDQMPTLKTEHPGMVLVNYR